MEFVQLTCGTKFDVAKSLDTKLHVVKSMDQPFPAHYFLILSRYAKPHCLTKASLVVQGNTHEKKLCNYTKMFYNAKTSQLFWCYDQVKLSFIYKHQKNSLEPVKIFYIFRIF